MKTVAMNMMAKGVTFGFAAAVVRLLPYPLPHLPLLTAKVGRAARATEGNR